MPLKYFRWKKKKKIDFKKKKHVRVYRLAVNFKKYFYRKNSSEGSKMQLIQWGRGWKEKNERTVKREARKRKGASPSSARSGERRQVCVSQRPAAKRETGIAAGVPWPNLDTRSRLLSSQSLLLLSLPYSACKIYLSLFQWSITMSNF